MPLAKIIYCKNVFVNLLMQFTRYICHIFPSISFARFSLFIGGIELWQVIFASHICKSCAWTPLHKAFPKCPTALHEYTRRGKEIYPKVKYLECYCQEIRQPFVKRQEYIGFDLCSLYKFWYLIYIGIVGTYCICVWNKQQYGYEY